MRFCRNMQIDTVTANERSCTVFRAHCPIANNNNVEKKKKKNNAKQSAN